MQVLMSVQPGLVDFDRDQTLPKVLGALDDRLDQLFPASKEIASLPAVEAIRDASAIFSTERSLSLWSQIVAPPPLQPQNWVKSRIRRLFLVSLGVPVDLDEILPASKQKKLVLPSMQAGAWERGNQGNQAPKVSDEKPAGTSGGSGSGGRTATAEARAEAAAEQGRARARDADGPAELDLLAVRRLWATTDAALDGLTDGELKAHVAELQEITQVASGVLEYWLKRRDGLVGEKEAFEGVIENLVSHARRVRR